MPADEVVEGPADASGEPTFTWNGEHANREFGKMGKSLKNIVTPDYMYENYGADTFRLYEMSMGRWTSLARGTPATWSVACASCSVCGAMWSMRPPARPM